MDCGIGNFSPGATPSRLPGALGAGVPVMATIEPWHGHQAVVYLPAGKADRPVEVERWVRHVVDDDLAEGHLVWWADFDRDGMDELLVGFRRNAPPKNLPGLNIYDFSVGDDLSLTWTKHVVDDGGMATEDALAADFDGDGWIDVAAFGRATKNIKLYLNQGGKGER